MITYEKSKPLINIHIPKCGGTSFNTIMKQWFGRKYYEHYPREWQGKPPKHHRLTHWWNPQQYISGLCIGGHFNKQRGFGIQDYYPEVEQFITILRDPIEIMVSNYFHAKKVAENVGLYRDGMQVSTEDKFQGIEDYLRDHSPYLLYHMPYEMTLDNYQEIIEKYFVYIGITEDLQTSVDRVAQKLGFESAQVPHKNVSPRNESITDTIRLQYREKHKLEYAIYDYVVAKYKSDW